VRRLAAEFQNIKAQNHHAHGLSDDGTVLTEPDQSSSFAAE
jgi:hypothetical protein